MTYTYTKESNEISDDDGDGFITLTKESAELLEKVYTNFGVTYEEEKQTIL